MENSINKALTEEKIKDRNVSVSLHKVMARLDGDVKQPVFRIRIKDQGDRNFVLF